MATEQFVNLAKDTLSAGISSSSLTLTPSNPSLFPPVPQFHIIVSAVDASGNFSNPEFMLVTGISGGVFTVTRGIEGSTAVNHAAKEIVALVLTADMMASCFPQGQLITASTPIAIGRYQAVTDIQQASPVPLAISLPANPVPGKKYSIIDGGGVCQTSNYTITDPNGKTIQGQASFVMKDFAFQANDFTFNGTNWSVS